MSRQGRVLFLDTDLARRMEQAEAATTAHYVAAGAALYPDRGYISQPCGDGMAFFTGAGSPINRVVALGMTEAADGDVLQVCERFYLARGETTRIDLCPLAHSSLIHAMHRSYCVAQFKHVFVRSLAGWPDVPWRGSGVTVAQVSSAEAELWSLTVAGAAAGGAPHAIGLEIARPNPYKPDTVCFLARIDGSSAGGGALAIHGGVAICYSTSVRPELRRMGVQGALLHARLSYAKDHGCELAMVQTSPGNASQRNVERFGFQIAYTKPTMSRTIPG